MALKNIYTYEVASNPPFRTGRGHPLPFGASITNEGINFSVFSRHANHVSIVLYNKQRKKVDEIPFHPAVNKTGDVWHILIYNLDPSLSYGYRVDGPYDPHGAGHCFNNNVILIDPYAKALTGGFEWGKPCANSPESEIQNSLKRASCIVMDNFDWEGDQPLNISLQNSIIYELHVRGFTVDPSSGSKNPGTFQGLIEKIPYLKALGVTAVELMPIAEFNENEGYFKHPKTGEKLKNYWGYSTTSFFAPQATYSCSKEDGQQVNEFKELVKQMHKAGLEVILDVVFNHTSEGGEGGPVISLKGLDNSIYYMLSPEKKDYMNFSGCGNTLNCNHPLTRTFIIDCLRYWVTEMHIDGFRFDLASILGRDQNGEVLGNPPLIERISEDPILSHTKIIAEAWDASGLYQVGSFYCCRWAEWNGRYRDDIRRFISGQPGMIPAVATRFAGSADLYRTSGRRPYHSINFITSHDGFTLYDLVSYNEKHNDDNGEDNRDGCGMNFSWNCGVEGETNNQTIMNLRWRQMKNYATLLLLSQGVPMILAGDEFGRTQRGNNNAYCQDNQISWVDWSLAETNAHLLRFFKLLIRLRRLHPVFRRGHFFVGEETGESMLKDIAWFGLTLHEHKWEPDAKCLSILMDGKSTKDKQKDDDFFIMINGDNEPHEFSIPRLPLKKKWLRLIDTQLPSPRDIVTEDAAKEISEEYKYKVMERTIVVLISKPPYYCEIRKAVDAQVQNNQ
jgi:glycogen operon protein